MALLRDEPAGERVEEEWIARGAAISAINLGETLYIRIRERGEDAAATEIDTIRKRSTVVEADWPLVLAAAKIKAGGGLSYADAFCVATADRLNAVLWTGDPEIVSLTEKLPCEVHDLRSAQA
ncbi:MAG: type II toxin-antitoxin system VapC family toxin [Solirubrobacterales bacterium]